MTVRIQYNFLFVVTERERFVWDGTKLLTSVSPVLFVLTS